MSADKPGLRVTGRSVLAFVLAPEPPLADWLEILDDQIARAPGFFPRRRFIADLGLLDDTEADAAIMALRDRQLRLIDIARAGDPPVGRDTGAVAIPDQPPEPLPEPEPVASLLIGEPVRSGQSIVFPRGDVTVVGAVASGAEVMAGGSIHVYGALRGRAIAGVAGNPAARIFCRRMEAELIAIDGLYKTADAIPPESRGKPAQAWLDGDSLIVEPLE